MALKDMAYGQSNFLKPSMGNLQNPISWNITQLLAHHDYGLPFTNRPRGLVHGRLFPYLLWPD